MDCKEGSETISYSAYNAHQISHHYCLHCSKSLNDWVAIREHYYEKCLKYQVDCNGCEFVFDCEDYVHHSCSLHYDYRVFELILVLANAFMQMYCIGITKSVSTKECEFVGGIHNFIVTQMPSLIFVFFAVCMYVNVTTLKKD